MRFNYWHFRQIGSEQWLVQKNLPHRIYVRLCGPLGINARIRNARIIRHILQLELPNDAKILDFGCGHAYAVFWLARRYPEYQFTAIDVNPDLIREGRIIADKIGLSNTCFIEGSIEKISKDATFDLIISMDVLEHIEDDIGVLTAFRKAIKANGVLLLHLPLRHQLTHQIFPVFKSFRILDHIRDEYTPVEITEKLDQTGYKIHTLQYGYSPWGEMAFELNYLFWTKPTLRVLTAILTHFLSNWLGYMDIRHDYKKGNSIIIIAEPCPQR